MPNISIPTEIVVSLKHILNYLVMDYVFFNFCGYGNRLGCYAFKDLHQINLIVFTILQIYKKP